MKKMVLRVAGAGTTATARTKPTGPNLEDSTDEIILS